MSACISGTVIVHIAIIAVTLCILQPAQAEEIGVTLWVPDQMIAGQTYHGAIILPDATQDGSLVLLSSASDLVGMPESLYVQPSENHGIFQIIPTGSTHAEIFATVNGRLYSTTTQVFSDTGAPDRLEVILPSNTTRTDEMTVYVAVLDENNLPVPLEESLDVTIASSGAVETPPSLTIKNGTFYGSFRAGIHGSGTVLASAHDLQAAKEDIQRLPDGFSVRVGVAPGIAMEDSYAHYYVWLEKDGKPFTPPGTVRAFLHSNDHNVARTHANPSFESDGLLVRLVGGVAKGILYTGDPGRAVISASIPEFGLGQDTLFVGPAGPGDLSGYNTTALDYVHRTEGKTMRTGSEPNLLLFWAYPDVTDDTAWGVAALYSLDMGHGPDMRLIPARLDGRMMYVSSGPGLEHREAYVMKEQLVKTNSMEFEVLGSSHGNHSISVSGQGMESSHSTVYLVPGYEEEFDLRIAGLPALGENAQDIAMISLVDGTGAMLDAIDMFGRDTEFMVSASGEIMPQRVAPVHAGSAILGGALHGTERITVILDGVGSTSADIAPAGMTTSLDLLVPGTVHVGEGFPFAAHEVDKLGTPLRKASSLRISTPLDLSVGRHMTLDTVGAGNISAISDAGATSVPITGFANRMDVQMDLDRTQLRVGEDARLEVFNTVSDANYTLITEYPFEYIGDSTFVVSADREGESVLSILATRPGYESVMLSAELSVLHVYFLDVDAIDSGGSRVYPPFNVRIGAGSESAMPPYHTEFRPGPVEIEFLQKYASETDGYELDHVMVNGRPVYEDKILLDPGGDLDVVAVYGRQVLINVVDGEGSGVYREGEVVTIRAPDRPVISFLIRDVFERWEGDVAGTGIDSSEEVLVADSDLNVVAVYRTDYTYLMVLVAAPLLAGSVFMVFKKKAGLRWILHNVLERLANTIDLKKAGGQRGKKM